MSFQYPPPTHPSQPPESAPPSGVRPHVQLPQHRPVVTYGILLITLGVYLLQMAGQAVYGTDVVAMMGMKNNAAIEAGAWWRLFTPIFLHGSIFHIGFNMYALYILGPGLERFYGSLRFLLLYLVAGFAGNVFSFMFSPYNSLGASTAIFGLLAAQGVFLYQHREIFGETARRSLANIIFIAAVNLVIGLSPGIDNWGHMGGLIGGLLFAWFGGPKLSVQFRGAVIAIENQRSVLFALLAAVGVMMIFLALAVAFGSAS